MGHVGLTESAQAVAAALGWDATGTSETIEPVVADAPTPSAFGTIEPGQIAGIDQVAVVVADGVERVRLHLQMAVGIGPSQDDIWLTGDPDLHLSVAGWPPRRPRHRSRARQHRRQRPARRARSPGDERAATAAPQRILRRPA